MSNKTENCVIATACIEGREDEKVSASLKIVPKSFVVHFRRPQSYAGDFGFDWLQDEFLTCTTLDKLKKEHNPCKILNQEYLVPWMSIKNGQQATVNLIIEKIEGTPSDADVIKLKEQNGISFMPEIIKVVDILEKEVEHFPSGKDVGIEVKITCKQALTKDTEIKVYDRNDEVIGKLSFSKNHKEYKLPMRIVLLVRKGYENTDEQAITTHLTANSNSDFNGASDLPDCMHKLENQMNYYAYNQAFVKCEMERSTSGDVKLHRVAIDEAEWTSNGRINSAGEIADRDDLNSTLLEPYKNQIERGLSGTGFFKGVVIFITNFEGEKIAGKGNMHIIDDRNCILFKVDSTTIRTRPDGSQYTDTPNGNIKMDTYVHEVGHVLSLAHPFQYFNKQSIEQRGQDITQIDAYLKNSSVSENDKASYWETIKDSYKRWNRYAYLFYRNKYFFPGTGNKTFPEKGSTKCLFMDSTPNRNRRVFTQWQWKTIQESVEQYFSTKKK